LELSEWVVEAGHNFMVGVYGLLKA
jgi:hypothetical protein